MRQVPKISIRIFSKVGNLGQGLCMESVVAGVCRYAMKLIFPIGNIIQLHHHLRWQVGGWGIFQAKEKATLFRGRLN